MQASNKVQEDRPLCPLCGEQRPDRIRIVYDRHLKLFRCKTCEMVFRVPIFGKLDVPKYELSYQQFDSNKQLEVQDEKYKQNSKLHVLYDWILTQIVAKQGKDISILDIGCSQGNFLDRAAAAGIEQCVGIEPQLSAISFIRSKGKYDHHIYEGYYSRKGFKEKTFDVIYHSHVLEHVEYPMTFLSDNYYHLREGGTLIVRVPSIRSPEYWLQVLSNNRIRSAILNPQHLVYFTPRTLKRSLEASGFNNIRIRTGLWAYKRPKLRLIWKVTVDPLFDTFKIGGILAFASR